jgi:site-specific recombinase XerD
MMRRKTRKRIAHWQKTKLGLPDLEHVKSAVLLSLRSPESQRSYRRSIEDFVAWYCSEPRLSFNKTVVTRYRIHLEDKLLAPGTINVRLAAVRRLAYEAADTGLLSPDLAAGIRRVKGAKKLGMRLGNWLTVEEARSLWQLPNLNTVKGKRDRAILAVLLGCGLRRGELRKGSVWGTEITEKVVWHVVKEYAGRLGVSKLAPHDLRRSCARLCHDSGGELEQIQFLLGHVSVQTTEKYLGCKQRFRQAVNDHLGIEPSA